MISLQTQPILGCAGHHDFSGPAESTSN